MSQVCPVCDGLGESLLHVYCRRGTSGYRLHPCSLCGGTGQITGEQAQWVADGAAMRERRKGAGRTMAEEAERRGCTVQELSKMENGYLEPVEVTP